MWLCVVFILCCTDMFADTFCVACVAFLCGAFFLCCTVVATFCVALCGLCCFLCGFVLLLFVWLVLLYLCSNTLAGSNTQWPNLNFYYKHMPLIEILMRGSEVCLEARQGMSSLLKITTFKTIFLWTSQIYLFFLEILELV